MSNEQLVVQGLVHAKLYLDASAAAALLASGCRRTQDANEGAELRRKAALPQLRGVHLADGCMYVHCCSAAPVRGSMRGCASGCGVFWKARMAARQQLEHSAMGGMCTLELLLFLYAAEAPKTTICVF